MTPGVTRSYPDGVARDEEFRKVAEDLRALGRSLARDFWQAADQARRSGRPPGHVIRHGLRQMAGEARRGLWGTGCPPRPGYYRRYGRDGRWAPPPTSPGGAPGRPPSAGQWGPGGWFRPGPARTWSPPPRPTRPAPPPVRRRWDSTTLAGLLIVLFGAAWLIGALGALRLPLEGVVAAGLMILGLAVIVTARTDWSLSRHIWPVWLGAGLLVVLIATSSTLGVGGALNHVSFGNMNRVGTPGSTVYGGFGHLSVDARGLPPGATLTVKSAAGQTYVTTPPGVPLDLRARVGAGRVCVGGRPQASGVEADVRQRFGTGPAAAVTLRVNQLAGEVVIDGPGC